MFSIWQSKPTIASCNMGLPVSKAFQLPSLNRAVESNLLEANAEKYSRVVHPIHLLREHDFQ